MINYYWILPGCLMLMVTTQALHSFIPENTNRMVCFTNQVYSSESRTLQDSPMKGSIEVDGSILNYVVEGDGIPCLVIGSSVYYPRTFSAGLRKHLKMYFVDMKWFAPGYVPEDLDSVTLETIVNDVEQIRKALGLKQPMIMGHSIHGTIAMEYVKKYAGKVSALVVIGSPSQWGNAAYEKAAADLWASASEERKELQQKNWGEVTELDRLTGREEAAGAYHVAAPQYWYDPEYDARWLWDDMTVHSEVTKHLFTTVFRDYNMFANAPLLKIPVIVVMGKYDYVIPYTLWNTTYTSIPDFTLHLFEKSGHTPQLEESQAFDEALLQWISRLDSKQ